MSERKPDRTASGSQVGNDQWGIMQPLARNFQHQRNRMFRDQLGFWARNEYPAINEQIQAPKRPMAEHVLQRLASTKTPQHRVEMRNRSLSHSNIKDLDELVIEVPARLFAQPARLRTAGERRCFFPESAPAESVAAHAVPAN